MFSTFREEHVAMVMLLLRFTKAERTDDWSLHLRPTSEMIPYFFLLWTETTMQGGLIPVYLADMTAPSAKHPFFYFFLFCHTTDNNTEILIK